jgi:cellulose synthase/poly-beta-1,6-N-acetylglucosamine synthase-like glycosyltransferase
MTIISALAAIALILYGLLVLGLIAALLRPVNPPPDPVDLPGVSVVIPFRNEAHNLDALLGSLFTQEYPGPWEIVLVNDSSTDDFFPIIARHQSAPKAPLRLIGLTVVPTATLSSKQRAIETGIAAARYDLVVLTDADMQFDRRWLRSLVQSSPNADLVFGHTEIAPDHAGLLAQLQKFQLDFLFATAYAFNRLGLAGSCMGNNLLVRKTAFTALGGFASLTGYSIVEDRDLLAAFRRQRLPIRPVEPFAPLATTLPAPTIGAFADQLTRWARGGFSLRSGLLPVGILFAVQNLVFLVSLISWHAPLPAALSFVNMALTLVFASVGFHKIHTRQRFWFFGVWYLFVLCEIVAFPLLFIVRPRVIWKERPV